MSDDRKWFELRMRIYATEKQAKKIASAFAHTDLVTEGPFAGLPTTPQSPFFDFLQGYLFEEIGTGGLSLEEMKP